MQVCHGAQLMCTMGIGPGSLVAITPTVLAGGAPAATIMDHAPFVNIPPFPLCNSIANPIVAAATAAKLGVFTPAACAPATPAPWVTGSSTVLIEGKPALTASSTCQCIYGGTISITFPGQTTVITG